jgi:AraC-like DNA-binding protein
MTDLLISIVPVDAASERIRAVIEYLAKARLPPRSYQVATHFKLSVSQLQHTFKLQTGVSMHLFCTSLRLHRAAEMLIWTGRPVKEVQYFAGFEDPANFNHAFRRHFGCTPTTLRRMQTKLGVVHSQQKIPIDCSCDERLLPILLALLSLSKLASTKLR